MTQALIGQKILSLLYIITYITRNRDYSNRPERVSYIAYLYNQK
jgi:hypothetical protein